MIEKSDDRESHVRTVDCRMATIEDLPALATLRWRFKADQLPIDEGRIDEGRPDADFVATFVASQEPRMASGELSHWLAVDGDHIVGAMSVVVVRKITAPDELDGRWGYLTNAFVEQDARGAGIGSTLIGAIANWAQQQALELLLVWPSDRAFPFYEKAGFRRNKDPLVLEV